MRIRSQVPKKMIMMNGTLRPAGTWHIAGMGPFEWVISHRGFFRMMGEDGFPSIYTPKRRRARRKVIPGLDYYYRRFRTEPLPDDLF